MIPTGAITQAIFYHEHKATLSKEDRINAVVELAEWGVYSNAHLSKITGVKPATVGEYTRKTDLTGGRFDPAALPHVLDVIANEGDGEPVRRAVAAGMSTGMIARLSGRPRRTLERWAEKAS